MSDKTNKYVSVSRMPVKDEKLIIDNMIYQCLSVVHNTFPPSHSDNKNFNSFVGTAIMSDKVDL